MNAVFSSIDELSDHLVPDPDAFHNGPEMLIATLTEGVIQSGVWTCDVGEWDEPAYSCNEVMVMVDGHLRITNADDGAVHDLRPGDMFALLRGWAGHWNVLEPMRKIYFIVE